MIATATDNGLLRYDNDHVTCVVHGYILLSTDELILLRITSLQ